MKDIEDMDDDEFLVDMASRGHYYVVEENGEKGLAWMSNVMLDLAGITVEEHRRMLEESGHSLSTSHDLAAKINEAAENSIEEKARQDRILDPDRREERVNEPDEESIRIAKAFFTEMDSRD
ncbi:MAG: hypothetical protein ACQGQO_03750 [Sphaerochaetaceae bacterium]